MWKYEERMEIWSVATQKKNEKNYMKININPNNIEKVKK